MSAAWAQWDEVRDALVLRGAIAEQLDALSIDTKRAIIVHVFGLQYDLGTVTQERDKWQAIANGR